MLNAIKLSIYIIIFFAQSMNSFTRVRDEITVPQLDTDETNVDLSDDSVTSLCHARCVAKCMDDKENCSICRLFASKSRMTDSCKMNQHCIDFCVWLNSTLDYPSKPVLNIDSSAPRTVALYWQPSESRSQVVYVVERMLLDLISEWEFLVQTTETSVNVTEDICAETSYRLAAVNQYGSHGFQTPVFRELPAPGSLTQVVYAPSRYDDITGYFLYELTFNTPSGWEDSDIYIKACDSFSKVCSIGVLPPVPICVVKEVLSHNEDVRYVLHVKIYKTAYGCSYQSRVYAKSVCGVEGPAMDFTINLTDCLAIRNYDCPPEPFRAPGPVRNVTCNVTDWSSREVLISWLPPEDLGTVGSVSVYFVEWGNPIYRGKVPLPQLEQEGLLNVSGMELSVVITANQSGVEYGVKVVATPLESDVSVEEELDLILSMAYFTIANDYDHAEQSEQEPSNSQVTSSSGVLVIIILAVLLLTSLFAVLVLHQRIRRTLHSYFHSVGSVRKAHSKNSQTIYNPFYFTAQPTSKDEWEVPRSAFTLAEELGRGAFGHVVKGCLSVTCLSSVQVERVQRTTGSTDTIIPVAIKLLLDDASETQRTEFLREINLMKTIGQHAHVISMLACCTLDQPLCLVVEHLPHGDLLHFLRRYRNQLSALPQAEAVTDSVTLLDIMSFARQIALGMEYLSEKGFVHRDLACRNVLVGDNKVVKIGDFGLTRYIYMDKNYVSHRAGCKLPLKWMAIESIVELTFTTASDVWSFGVVLFELVTLGCTPYPTMANRSLLAQLQSGYRMEQPEGCPNDLYELMLMCWRERSSQRPSFVSVRERLEEMMLCERVYTSVLHLSLSSLVHIDSDSSSSHDHVTPDSQSQPTHIMRESMTSMPCDSRVSVCSADNNDDTLSSDSSLIRVRQ